MEAKRNSGHYGRDPEISQRNQSRIRGLIEVEKIVKKLNDHILGKAKMTNTMVRSAEILLRKIQPDLTAIQLSTDNSQGVPLLKIVRAAEAQAIEAPPAGRDVTVVDGLVVAESEQSGADAALDGADGQIEHVSVSSSKVMPD